MAEAKLPPVRSTLVDRMVSYFDPVRGRERLRARAQLAIAGQWLGGSTTRTQTLNWLPYGGSADADMQVDRRVLRQRSRDLSRNNPLGRGAVNNVVTSAVGTGLSLRSRINAASVRMTPEQVQALQRQIEAEFRLWSEDPSMCDAERTLDFYALQALAFRSALESGDVLASLPWIAVGNLPYELKVQLIEADRVCNKGWAADTERLFGGVDHDKYGAPTAYHVLRQHPGGLFPLNYEWDILPAFGAKTGRRNVLHLFDKLRPGQARGVPYLSPVIETLRQLGEYTDGELRAALVSSLFTVFVKNTGGLGLEPDATGAAGTTTPQTGDLVKLGAGAIVELGQGDDISTANPGRPNTAFDGFVLALLKQIGTALEQPFEVLVKHFNASYSASQAALLEVWRFYKGRRAWLAGMFCQPVYEAWLDEAVTKRRIVAPGYFDDPAIRAAFVRSEWIGDAKGSIDPLKEVQAAEKRLALLLTSFSDECTAGTGQDFDDVLQRRAVEEKMIDAVGLHPVLEGARSGVPVDPNSETPTDGGVGGAGGGQ